MRTALAAILALLTLAACGPAGEKAVIHFELLGAAATTSNLKGFQLTVLNNSIPVDCAIVEQTCLNHSLYYAGSNVIPVIGPDGNRHDAVFFPANLSGTSTQDLSVSGIPPGTNDAVVVEALTNSAPPQFLGSFCGIQSQVHTGANTPTFSATLTLLTTPIACDPTIY